MRIMFLVLVILFGHLLSPSIGQAKPSVSADHAVLIEQSTGRILYEKDAHQPDSIASITKIMTAIIAIESGKMQETTTVSRDAVYTEGSSIYLEQGEEIKIEDLVYGLMLRSGNDSAVAIAEHVGGSLEGFVYLMNKKAKWLGMTNTHFDNPHGLDSEKHYSSAYDMALLMRYAMDNKDFREVTGASSYKSENRSYAWQNKNKLLTRLYDYCIGGKTGFTKATGRTLVSAAEKDDMQLIAVTLNDPDDWRDHIAMFEWGFENYDMEQLKQKGQATFNLVNQDKKITGYFKDNVIFPLTEEEREKIEFKNYILKENKSEDESIIGKSVFLIDGEAILETPVYQNELEQPEGSFVTNLFSVFKKVIGM